MNVVSIRGLNYALRSMRINYVFKNMKRNMAAWRCHLNTISTASELDEEISSNKETSADNGILREGYADKSDQEEASRDESKISRQSSAGKCNSRKKVGKSSWKEEEIADIFDIVCNSEYYKKKIIFTNSKNSKNNDVYSKLKNHLQEHVSARGQDLQFTVAKLRNK